MSATLGDRLVGRAGEDQRGAQPAFARWSICAIAVVAVHVSAGWIALHVHVAENVAPPPPPMLIELPPARPARPVPPHVRAAAPSHPIVRPPPPQRALLTIVPRAPAPHIAVPVPPKAPAPVKESAQRAKAVTAKPAMSSALAPAAIAAPSQADAPPAPALAATAPPAAAPASNAVPTWQGLVLARLQRFKRYPNSAQLRHQQGVAYLRFTMDRHGKVLTATIDQSSGSGVLDEETLQLIHRAEPLPAPPADVPGDSIELVVPIQYFLKES